LPGALGSGVTPAAYADAAKMGERTSCAESMAHNATERIGGKCSMIISWCFKLIGPELFQASILLYAAGGRCWRHLPTLALKSVTHA
jgi:hypothetical protein